MDRQTEDINNAIHFTFALNIIFKVESILYDMEHTGNHCLLLGRKRDSPL